MEKHPHSEDDAVRILIIDDEEASQITAKRNIRELFANLKDEDLVIKTARTIEAGIEKLTEEPVHIVLLDKDLGKDRDGNVICGIDFIKDILAVQPFTQILMLTGDLSYLEITRALKTGASDYLLKSNKPEHADYRNMIIHRAVKQAKEELENLIQEKCKVTGIYSNYVCESPAMQRFDQKIEAISESSRPLLFLGATGLGKGAVARRVNDMRRKFRKQSKRPFVNINIGALSDQLAQSELFGHEANSFTGAGNRHKGGLIDAAQYGDIFLDEIGDASAEMQLKLLKVVEENVYKRVGGQVAIRTNACFIFATNKNLKALVEEGKFRADLYHRISAFEIEVPPLEERKSDLPAIIKGILRTVLKDLPHKNVAFDDFPDDLIQYLCRDEIPGNIRGIENDVMRLITLSQMDQTGIINLKDWRKTLGHDSKPAKKTRLDSIELSHLRNLDTNLLTDEFPGIKKLKDLLERKIMQEARHKNYTLTKTANLMKIAKSTLSIKAKSQNFSFSDKGTKNADR